MPSKAAVKFKKVTAENAVIRKTQEIMTAKSAVKSQKWRQIMPSYIKSDGKICRHFTLSGVSGAFPLTQKHFGGDVTNAYLAADPSFSRKFNDADDTQNCVFYSIKFLTIRIYTDLVISKVMKSENETGIGRLGQRICWE